VELALALIWIVCGVASGVIAADKGRSGCLWAVLGFVLGPIGLAFSASLAPAPSQSEAFQFEKRKSSSPGAKVGVGLALVLILGWCVMKAPTPTPAADPRKETLTERSWLGPGDWPFTVSEVTLHCAESFGHESGAVTVIIDGRDYALNGTAKSRYPDMRPFWKEDPDPELAAHGLKVNIGPMIDRGLALC
jgi:hypothetical protein